jgi:hypothetical protein
MGTIAASAALPKKNLLHQQRRLNLCDEITEVTKRRVCPQGHWISVGNSWNYLACSALHLQTSPARPDCRPCFVGPSSTKGGFRLNPQPILFARTSPARQAALIGADQLKMAWRLSRDGCGHDGRRRSRLGLCKRPCCATMMCAGHDISPPREPHLRFGVARQR